ncbi:hypothetical protein A2G06_01100 [Geobacter anodireducens]|nr:hypothetical protein A2G06_01100 [Geobacter anodireducens]
MSWRKAKLQDLVYFQRGFDITKAQQKPGPYPVISSSGVTSYHNEYMVSGPCVVIGRKGTLGSVHFAEGDFWPHDTTLWSKELNGNDPRFIYFFMKTIDLASFNVGGANPTLNRNHIHQLDISIPALPTQQKIASILSAYDDLIENNQRRIQLLEDSARLLYQEWFVQLRFPGHEHTRIVDGVPEGWERTKLGLVAQINAETLPGSFKGVIDYVDISSVSPGSIDEITTFDFEAAPSRARRVVKHGDIIWSCVRPNRRSHAIVWNPQANLVASTGFAVITPVLRPTSFVYFAITTDAFVGHLVNRARGAAYPAVTAGDFSDAEIVTAPRALTEAFDELVKSTLDQMYTLRMQNLKLKQARDLLLPRLMSGEITA